jgi:hypothetical protein
MYIYLLLGCDSSIGIGKATRHHEFNNDEIGFCLVLGIVCPEQIVLVRLLNMQYFGLAFVL